MLGIFSAINQGKDIKPTSLKLQIDAENTTFKLGDDFQYGIKINATLRNAGNESLNLILPGEGSPYGWRSPIVTWSVSKIDERNNSTLELDSNSLKNPRCGNVNSVRESEFIELKPSEETGIEEWLGRPNIPNELGKYSIKLTYKNDPKLKWKNVGIHGHGNHAKKLLRKARKTDESFASSNELIIEIVE